jgi:proteic killer suppression protein
MEYFGNTSKLTKILGDERLRTKHYGKNVSRRIRERLEEFETADTLADISHLPPARLHALNNDKDHHDVFAVDVSANYRMVFEGYDRHDEQSTTESEIVTINVMDIEDYH